MLCKSYKKGVIPLYNRE